MGRLEEDIFICISRRENFDIWITMALNFVPQGLLNNKFSLIQVICLRQNQQQTTAYTNDE